MDDTVIGTVIADTVMAEFKMELVTFTVTVFVTFTTTVFVMLAVILPVIETVPIAEAAEKPAVVAGIQVSVTGSKTINRA